VRRLAEAHFYIILPLQFDDRVQEALSHCRAAQRLMRGVKDEVCLCHACLCVCVCV